MARIEDTYARDYAQKNITAWALGAYNPRHEQIPLNDQILAPRGCAGITAGTWIAIVGISIAMWGMLLTPLWTSRT